MNSTSDETKKLNSSSQVFVHRYKRSFTCTCWKIVKIIARIFIGAIIFTVLASLAPELKERIPSFYVIVDFVLRIFEGLCKTTVNFFGLMPG